MSDGYCIVTGSCAYCGRLIQFHPHKVPSIRLRIDGAKEPLCRACFSEWNRIHRTSKGMEPVQLHPDAYSPFPENEL